MSPLLLVAGSRTDQIQGGTFLLAYNVLKGGGQISDTEGREAKAALNKLQHTDVDEATYRKNLQEFRDEIVKLKEIARQRAAARYSRPRCRTGRRSSSEAHLIRSESARWQRSLRFARSILNIMTYRMGSWRTEFTRSSIRTCHGISLTPKIEAGSHWSGAAHPDEAARIAALPDLHAQAVERAKAGFRAFANPFGISDEIGGAITGVGDVLGGGSFSEGYNRFTTRARAIDKPLEEKYPVETIGGAVLGGIATGAPPSNC